MSNIFGASSAQYRRNNSDGSHNVYCSVCREFVARSFTPVNRVLCAICDRVQQGGTLTAESMLEYKLSKAGREDVSAFIAPVEEPVIGRKKFSLRSMAGDLLEAVGIPRMVVEPKSAAMARGKRHQRLFANIDLGTMSDVDAQLKKPKE